MKRIFILGMLIVVVGSSVYSQTDSTRFNLYSKRGFYYFPEKGDWSVSISATPFLNYFGGLFGDNIYRYENYNSSGSFYIDEEAPGFAFTAQNPGTIFFKYYNKDNSAYRIKLLFGFTSEKDKLGSGTEMRQDNYIKQSALSIGLSVGQEFYRPIKSRLRGYYGYEAGIFSRPYYGLLYQYDNGFFTGKVEYVDESMAEDNFTEKGGNTFGLNGSGFIGVEWFFAPKMSLGGEFGLGLNYSKMTERKHESESDNVIVDSGANGFTFEPYASGDLIIHLYF